MNERTEAILETAKPFVFGAVGAAITVSLLTVLGIEWFCILFLIGLFGYFTYLLYCMNLERIQTLRKQRNDALINKLKSD